MLNSQQIQMTDNEILLKNNINCMDYPRPAFFYFQEERISKQHVITSVAPRRLATVSYEQAIQSLVVASQNKRAIQGSNFWTSWAVLGGIVCRHPNNSNICTHASMHGHFIYINIYCSSLLPSAIYTFLASFPFLFSLSHHGVCIQQPPAAALPAAADQDVYRHEEFL